MENKKKSFLVCAIIFLSIALATAIFIIYQSCQGGEESKGWSDPVTEIAANIVNSIQKDTINDTNIDSFSVFIRKAIGHFGLFGFQSTFTTLGFYFLRKYVIKREILFTCLFSISIGLFLATLTELIQTFVPGRCGDILDSLIDFSGYLVALIILVVIFLAIKRKANKKPIEANQ